MRPLGTPWKPRGRGLGGMCRRSWEEGPGLGTWVWLVLLLGTETRRCWGFTQSERTPPPAPGLAADLRFLGQLCILTVWLLTPVPSPC